MDRSFLAGEQGEDAPPPAPPPPPPAEPPFNMSELQHFPMRAKCLSTHTTLPDLPPHQRTRFLRYLADAVEGLPELKDIMLRVEASYPKYTRIKELIESIEAFKLVVSYLATVEYHREVTSFFDLACGHGLVGVMLAYAYPHRRVMVRPCSPRHLTHF